MPTPQEIKKILAEQKVRRYVRKRIIEHYAVNGYKDLTPEEVQHRFLQLEAKAKKAKAKKGVINGTAKEDKKLLGAKKSNGNSEKNADWITSKNPKAKKDININATKSDPVKNRTEKQAKFFVAKAGVKKPKNS